tara:strand:- start:585 stop:1127 length:543 start_codon:yes stop_codon:yes gene_type:complete
MSLLFNPTDGKNRRRFREYVRNQGNQRVKPRQRNRTTRKQRVKRIRNEEDVQRLAVERHVPAHRLIEIIRAVVAKVGADIPYHVAVLTTLSLLTYMAQQERKFLSANHTVPTLELPVVQEAVMPYLYQEQLRQGVLQEVPEQTVKEVGGALNLLITAAGTAAGAIGSVVGAMVVLGSAME